MWLKLGLKDIWKPGVLIFRTVNASEVLTGTQLQRRILISARVKTSSPRDAVFHLSIRKACSGELSVADYEKKATSTMNFLSDFFDTLPELVECDKDYDVDYAMGVLTVKVSEQVGVYVINMQPPNRQIWLSSPISGPKRYDYVNGNWLCSRDGVSLDDILTKEFRGIYKCDKITIKYLSMALNRNFFTTLRFVQGRSAWFCKRQLSSMRAWVVRDFSEGIALETDLRVPEITHPNHAASVNPIDTVMQNGYGNTVFSYLKQFEECSLTTPSRLPFIGGRDCSGTVVYRGREVKKFKEGDEVMGVIGGTYAGSHAEYVLAMDSWLVPKPNNISFVEAASLPYSACTAWSALVSVARICPENPGDIRVLIHGGAGGVGTVAIQMLKAWGIPVVVSTCSCDSYALVQSLGAVPVDYNDEVTAKEKLVKYGPFEVIMDCAESDLAEWSDNVLGIWRNCIHVSVISPLLHDADRYGLVPGLLSAAAKYFRRSSLPALSGRWFSYAFFAPHPECLTQLKEYVETGQVKPIVEATYAFEDIPKAYEKVFERHGRGKTVIDFTKEPEARSSLELPEDTNLGTQGLIDDKDFIANEQLPADSEVPPKETASSKGSENKPQSPDRAFYDSNTTSETKQSPSKEIRDQSFNASIKLSTATPTDKKSTLTSSSDGVPV
ncbi:unnamed protein product [Enterobius vermicularis]|uniref:ferroxidase n=1 Tax=Enterobius vermicularis TaxID=51028 RepID=A0A0N4V3R0_ENTVE|nr:unnamed protein product [Enterobius vermicularis]